MDKTVNRTNPGAFYVSSFMFVKKSFIPIMSCLSETETVNSSSQSYIDNHGNYQKNLYYDHRTTLLWLVYYQTRTTNMRLFDVNRLHIKKYEFASKFIHIVVAGANATGALSAFTTTSSSDRTDTYH